MSNELKKQSKQTEVQKIDTETCEMLSMDDVAKHFGITRQGASKKMAELGAPYITTNCGAKMFKMADIQRVQLQQQQQVALAKLDTKTDKMNNQYSFDELKIAFGKSLENQSSKEIGNLGLQLIAIAMNKQSEAFAKENEEKDELLKQLEAKNQELQAYQNENKYIQETKHKIDVLKAKITKAVRTKAYQNHWTYKETYVRYYKLYDEAHNFPYKEDYNGYINTVEKRGHLLELYNIIVNDF